MKNKLLKETPDAIVDWDGDVLGDKELHWDDPNAFAFTYIDNKLYMAKRHKYMFAGRDTGRYSGRVWFKEKVFSFWEYPENINKLKSIITDIENEVSKAIHKSFKIWNNGYYIEISISNGRITKKWSKDSMFHSKLIPLEDYSTSINPERIDHTLSPMAKNDDVPDDLGSNKRPSGLPYTQMKQLISTSENKETQNIMNNTNVNEAVTNYEFGCLMLKLNIPNWKKIISLINPNDVYDPAGENLGIEYEPHVTIVFGFNPKEDIEKIKKITYKLKVPITGVIYKISTFENPDYDVVKLDVESRFLKILNKYLTRVFNVTKTQSAYNPHITIAYCKKGTGKKYIKKLKNNIKFSSNIFKYSSPNMKSMVWKVNKNIKGNK